MEYLEHLFMNSAALSEQWAADDLFEKSWKYYTKDKYLPTHAEDEYRHARMLYKIMDNCGFHNPITDEKHGAMHFSLYNVIGGLDLKTIYNDHDAYKAMHEILEHRAVWIYKTYLKGGTIEKYKNLLKIIIAEEADHLNRGDMNLNNYRVKLIKEVDEYIFKDYIPNKYGNLALIKNPQFWLDYYKYCTNTGCNKHFDTLTEMLNG